jgi:methyltransferase (TIGR00027 family)
MQADRPSRTAISTALMRGRHTRLDPHRIFTDDWADRVLPGSVRDAFAQAVARRVAWLPAGASSDEIIDAWAPSSPPYANVITRSRHAEDALHAAVKRGVRQYVLVGAGFDTYALRRPEAGKALRVFEVDHPHTQVFKLNCIAQCGEPPADAHFVASDLAQESLADALKRSPFDFSAPTFFSWLGVTMYLPREANLAALAGMAQCSANGSELVFTYIDQRAFDPDGPAAAKFAEVSAQVAAIGEPFLSGFLPEALAGELRATGWRLLEDLRDADLVARYDPAGVDGLRGGGYGRIAHARVMEERG